MRENRVQCDVSGDGKKEILNRRFSVALKHKIDPLEPLGTTLRSISINLNASVGNKRSSNLESEPVSHQPLTNWRRHVFVIVIDITRKMKR